MAAMGPRYSVRAAVRMVRRVPWLSTSARGGSASVSTDRTAVEDRVESGDSTKSRVNVNRALAIFRMP